MDFKAYRRKKNRSARSMRSRALMCFFAIALLLLFCLWVRSWLGLIAVPFVFDAYITKKIPVENTVYSCDELRSFQKVYKLSSKYKFVVHNEKIYTDKCYRVFTSKDDMDTYLGKSKGEGCTIEKFASCPDHCRVVNTDITNERVPYWLDREWYVNEAKKRLKDKFGVIV